MQDLPSNHNFHSQRAVNQLQFNHSPYSFVLRLVLFSCRQSRWICVHLHKSKNSENLFIFFVTLKFGLQERLWRKTRKPHGCPFDVGADPNRNWDVHWLEANSLSQNPCFEIYAGPSPFSENCTRVLSNFISTVGDKLLGYITFHSYSQLLLLPYGYTKAHLDNYEELVTTFYLSHFICSKTFVL